MLTGPTQFLTREASRKAGPRRCERRRAMQLRRLVKGCRASEKVSRLPRYYFDGMDIEVTN